MRGPLSVAFRATRHATPHALQPLLPADFVTRWLDHLVRIPTTSHVRSHNLGNSASIACYEVVRQAGWRGETPMPG